ncbi:EpsG family protein [Gracilimonas sediminicola]|uniref:EpsG family protein n=1 Tax=Gracilimonas sediminicola TaxID=2952158 RepID=UPI0038D4ECA4
MIQSFILYGLFSFTLWRLGVESWKRQKIYKTKGENLTFWTWDIVFAIIIFSVISGIRWNVGVDYLSYLEGYQNLVEGAEFNKYGTEFGFEYLSSILAKLNLHFVFFFAFWAFIQAFFFYYAIRKERYLMPYVGFIIIWGGYYLSWMNGMRQMIVACMFVFAVQFIKERKFIPYLILLMAAATIHKSAVLLIVFYFFPRKDIYSYRYLNIILLGTSFYIGLNPNWLSATSIVEQILSIIGYEWYSQNLELLIEKKEILKVGPRRILIMALVLVNIWYAPRIKKYFSNTNYLIYFNFMFTGALLYNLFSNASHIFLRPVEYLNIFTILTTAYLLYYFKPQRNYIVSKRFLVVISIVFLYLAISIIAGSYGVKNDHTNFRFFWSYI